MTISEDHRWLIGEEAARWLERVAEETSHQAILPAYVKTLRRDLGITRTSLVLEQVQLRNRAAEKFSHAEQLFFTPKGFEQATDEVLACYKARRYSAGEPVHDLCCGIGGDAFGLLQRCPVQLVDREELSLFFARENVRRLGGAATSCSGDVTTLALPSGEAWHIDPDRRSTGPRTTRIELGEPGVETLNRLLASNPRAGIKLAPATDLPVDWRERCQAEWIETRGECRQLVAWFDTLATSSGKQTATVLDRLSHATSFTGEADLPVPTTDQLGKYVYDPSPALLAAHLLGAWCEEQHLQALAGRSLYLTNNTPLSSPLLQTFRVVDLLPLDIPQLRSYVRVRGIGTVEIKQRGLGITPESLRPQLNLQGEEVAVILLTEIGKLKRAIVCQRA